MESHGTNVIRPCGANPQLLRFATVQLSNAAEKPGYAARAPLQRQESEAAERKPTVPPRGGSRAAGMQAQRPLVRFSFETPGPPTCHSTPPQDSLLLL